MRIELRGSLRAAFGVSSVEFPCPGGTSLRCVVEQLAAEHPRMGRYLVGESGNALRIVLNGTLVEAGSDPRLRDDDSLLLLHAIAGGLGKEPTASRRGPSRHRKTAIPNPYG